MTTSILSAKQRHVNTFLKLGTLSGDVPRVSCDICHQATPITQVELATFKGRSRKERTGVPYRLCPDCAQKVRNARGIAVEMPVHHLVASA